MLFGGEQIPKVRQATLEFRVSQAAFLNLEVRSQRILQMYNADNLLGAEGEIAEISGAIRRAGVLGEVLEMLDSSTRGVHELRLLRARLVRRSIGSARGDKLKSSRRSLLSDIGTEIYSFQNELSQGKFNSEFLDACMEALKDRVAVGYLEAWGEEKLISHLNVLHSTYVECRRLIPKSTSPTNFRSSILRFAKQGVIATQMIFANASTYFRSHASISRTADFAAAGVRLGCLTLDSSIARLNASKEPENAFFAADDRDLVRLDDVLRRLKVRDEVDRQLLALAASCKDENWQTAVEVARSIEKVLRGPIETARQQYPDFEPYLASVMAGNKGSPQDYLTVDAYAHLISAVESSILATIRSTTGAKAISSKHKVSPRESNLARSLKKWGEVSFSGATNSLLSSLKNLSMIIGLS